MTSSSFLSISIFHLLLLGPFQSEAMKTLTGTGTGTVISHPKMVNSPLSANLSSHHNRVHFPIGGVQAGPISIKGDNRNRNAVVVKAAGANDQQPNYVDDDHNSMNLRQAEMMKKFPEKFHEKPINGQLEEADKEELTRIEGEKTEEQSNSHGIG
jgi:hypothetical protein